MELKPFADNFIPVIFVDTIEHTDEHPFCLNPSCGCHEDTDLVSVVNQQYQDGLLTAGEATRTIEGRQLW